MAAVSAGAVAAIARDALAQDRDLQTASAIGQREVNLSPPGELASKNGASMSIEERLAQGKLMLASIERSAETISRQLQVARKERDVVRVLCLNDKLNQVDVAQRSAQDRLSALESATERKDADRSRHEYTVLEVLADRVRVLVNESNQCVGEETGFIGEGEVSVTIDPNLPDADTGFGSDPSSVPPPPNISSPVE